MSNQFFTHNHFSIYNNIMNHPFLIILLLCVIFINLFIQYKLFEGYKSLNTIYSNQQTASGTTGGSGAYSTSTELSDTNYDETTGLSKINYKFAPDDATLSELLDYSTEKNIQTGYNVEYHDSPEKIAEDTGYGLDKNTSLVFDTRINKLVIVEYPKMQNLPTYYIPGKYKYGAKNYVPTYTDGVVLSH
jgi:hypothetical protein